MNNSIKDKVYYIKLLSDSSTQVNKDTLIYDDAVILELETYMSD